MVEAPGVVAMGVVMVQGMQVTVAGVDALAVVIMSVVTMEEAVVTMVAEVDDQASERVVVVVCTAAVATATLVTAASIIGMCGTQQGVSKNKKCHSTVQTTITSSHSPHLH